jgi:hypothetical protein
VSQRIHDVPSVPLADGRSKISAAWLIERAGFKRGDSRGNVGISTKHALALVNRGNATARELLSFANEICTAVQDLAGVTLQIEPVLVGFQNDETYEGSMPWSSFNLSIFAPTPRSFSSIHSYRGRYGRHVQ